MRAKTPLLPWWALAACLPSPPIGSGDETHIADESSEAWHEIDPPEGAGELGSTGPPNQGDEDGSTEGGAPDDEPTAQAELRILEVRFDPDGTDGGPDGPELLRLINRGPEPYPLEALRLEARSWPVLDAEDLPPDALSSALEVGQSLVIHRYRNDAGVPAQVQWQDQALELVLVHDSGLRNSDGAALAYRPDGSPSDQVCWGEVSPPEPYDDPAQWTGPCPPVEEGALCRIDPETDTDSAADWAPCPTPDTKKPRR